MPRETINGLGIEYELHGPEGGQTVALTPGGRFHMDTPGIRQFAQDLAAGGRRVLIYDRPNCGKSDAFVGGISESENQAEVLAALIRRLGWGPTAIIGGSGGARVSLLTAGRNPELCSHLAVWWVSGEPIGLMQLAGYYAGEAAIAASRGGMEAVLNASSWAENLAMSPTARATLQAMDPAYFIAVMQRWATSYQASDISPVPGMKPVDFARIAAPAIVFRSDTSDLAHTRTTSEWVHRLLPQSRLLEPPWRPDEWNYQSGLNAPGRQPTIFTSWPKLAPTILEFTAPR